MAQGEGHPGASQALVLEGLDGLGGPVEVGAQPLQDVIEVADQEPARDDPDEVAGCGVARLRRRRLEDGVGHLQGLQAHDLDAQPAVHLGCVARVLGEAADPQPVEGHLRGASGQAEGDPTLVQALGHPLQVVGDEHRGVRLDRSVGALQFLDGVQVDREHRVARVVRIEVPLWLDASGCHGERLVGPQEMGDVRVAGEGLAPVGVSGDAHLVHQQLGHPIGVGDHEVAGEQHGEHQAVPPVLDVRWPMVLRCVPSLSMVASTTSPGWR